jgi:hypothetical protein
MVYIFSIYLFRRNIDRFPEDFMFELSEEEIEVVVSQNVIKKTKK